MGAASPHLKEVLVPYAYRGFPQIHRARRVYYLYLLISVKELHASSGVHSNFNNFNEMGRCYRDTSRPLMRKRGSGRDR